MIDWDRLNTLRDDIGEEDFADVACLFVTEIREKLAAMGADPASATADDFHFLRGSAVNLGLADFAAACTAAEAACRAGAAPDIPAIGRVFSASLSAIAPGLPAIAGAA